METYSWYNVTVVLFAAFGSIFTGYTLAVFGYALGQPTFYASLGLVADPTLPGYAYTDAVIGGANGALFGAGFFGCFLAGWVGNRWGRVIGFRVAAVTGIIGGALQCGSQSVAMFMVARIVAGLAAGHTMAAMPTYFAEVAPPHSRGLITGAHGVGINVGFMMAGWIGVGCYFAADTTFAWRFPFAVVVLWAVCLLGGSFFVPESPRFLIQRSRHDEALDVLTRLHRDPQDNSNRFAHQELSLIEQRWQVERNAVDRDGKWRLLTVKSNRTRLGVALMVMFGGQDIGPLVINSYNVLLYSRLGVGPVLSLVLAALYNTVALICAFVGSMVSDRLGRRRAMLIGYTLNIGIFATLTALIAKSNETSANGFAIGAITMVFVYGVNYVTFVDLNQFTIATEIFPTHIRNQASSAAISGLFLADILWLNLLPTALSTIGWKYYLIFACLGVLHTAWLFFYLPETAGWHLEEMDNAMAGNPRLSTAVHVDKAVGGGDVTHVDTINIEKE